MLNCLIELTTITRSTFFCFTHCICIVLISINWIDCLTNDQLKRYEIINFQTKTANSLPHTNQAILEFKDKLLLVDINAFEKHFRLIAFVDHPLEVHIYENGKRYPTYFNKTHFVGSILDQPGSKVMGYLTNNRFLGLIYDNDQIYHLDLVKSSNKVIMYRESDVITANGRASEPIDLNNNESNELNKLSFKLSNLSSFVKRNFSHIMTNRFKRSFQRKTKRDNAIRYPKRPVACHIELIADHTFAESFNYDTNLIANEMHLQLMKANEIYQDTDFNQDGFPEGVSLRTANIIIFKDENATGYAFSDLNLNPPEILNAFSTRIQNHCLAFAFLNRDFSIFPDYKGVLGLAYLSKPESHSGLCSEPAINQKISTSNIVVSNVGILTAWFRGKGRPRAEVAQTLAHEIGHLFGSRHDNGEDFKRLFPNFDCPNNYLMSSIARFGPTSTIFTQCSKFQINRVLEVKSGCFIELKSFCGNGITEEGEECDCGPAEICEQFDRCCIPNTCTVREECRQNAEITNIPQSPNVPQQPFVPEPPAYNPNVPQQPFLTRPPAYNPNVPQQPFVPGPPVYNPNVPQQPFVPGPPVYNPNAPQQPLVPRPPMLDFPKQPNIPAQTLATFQPITPNFHPFTRPNEAGSEQTDELDIKRKKPNKSNPKPVTFDGTEDISEKNKFNSFKDQLVDSKWTQNYLVIFFIIGPILFLVWLLRDTCLDYRKKRRTKKKKKAKNKKKKKGHKRLIEEEE